MNEQVIAHYVPTAHQKIAVILLAAIGLWWVVSSVRRRLIREEHALLWILGLCGIMTIVLADPLLILITAALGVKVPASALLLLTIFFLFLICVRLTSAVSVQKQQIAKLIISTSILKLQMTERRQHTQSDNGSTGDQKYGRDN